VQFALNLSIEFVTRPSIFSPLAMTVLRLAPNMSASMHSNYPYQREKKRGA
jgi:hypothetical protein